MPAKDSVMQWLQAARFWAALAVLLHHGKDQLRDMGGPTFLVEAFQYGFAGADVFFVLSGIIMWRSTVERVGGTGAFLEKRFTRIYSGYWPVFVLYWLALPQERVSERWDRLGSILLVNQNHWENFIPPAWSLALELYFYVLFSLLLFVAEPGRRLKWVCGAGLTLAATSIASWGKPTPLIADVMVLEFGMGIGLAALAPQIRAWKVTAGWLVALGVLFAVGGINNDMVFGLPRVLAFGGMAGCFVGALLLADIHGTRRPLGLWVRLGDSSFALYLLHMLMLDWFWRTGFREWSARTIGPVPGFTIWLVAIVAVSHLWYLMVERRMLAVSRMAVERCRQRVSTWRGRLLAKGLPDDA